MGSKELENSEWNRIDGFRLRRLSAEALAKAGGYGGQVTVVIRT